MTKAAILTIGSELLSGQITDRNSSFLSAELIELDIIPVVHVTVDDLEDQIKEQLSILAKQVDLIVLTGGLGPTCDDITRLGVSKWCGQSLTFRQASWDKIVTYFESFGKDTPESNKQQCDFPKGSSVFENPVGTADAFSVKHDGVHVVVLPGPPKEISVIWQDCVKPFLAETFKGGSKPMMLSFRTIGVGESAIVEMIAEFVKFPEVKVAYRASAPYIEIKFFSESNHENLLQEIYSNCLGVLKDFVYEEDGENWIKDFGKLVLESKIPVCLSDSFTGGLVMTEVSSQLFKLGRHPGDLNLLTLWDNSTDSKTWVQECLAWGEEDQVSLAVAADSSLNWTAGVFINGRRLLETKPLPYQVTSQSVRNEKAVAYLTIKQWTKQWRDSESVVH